MMLPGKSCKLCGTPMSVGMQGEGFFSCTVEQHDTPTRSPIPYERAGDPSCVEGEKKARNSTRDGDIIVSSIETPA